MRNRGEPRVPSAAFARGRHQAVLDVVDIVGRRGPLADRDEVAVRIVGELGAGRGADILVEPVGRVVAGDRDAARPGISVVVAAILPDLAGRIVAERHSHVVNGAREVVAHDDGPLDRVVMMDGGEPARADAADRDVARPLRPVEIADHIIVGSGDRGLVVDVVHPPRPSWRNPNAAPSGWVIRMRLPPAS